MSDNVVIESNTKEEVAYKLMCKILGAGRQDRDEVLQTYCDCLKVTTGLDPKYFDEE